MNNQPLTPDQRLRQQVEQFVPLTDDDWNLLAPHLTTSTLKKHALFAQEGRVSREVGFVIDGMFRQFYTKDGEERTTYFFFENHFLSAYISCLTGKPSLITIEALSDSTYIGFPYAILKNLFEQRMVWQKFGRLIAEYLTIGLEERMAGLLLLSPEERYLDLLEGGKKKILERVPQHYIANYLGITPVSMSRIRNRIQKK
ncbi:cyclic nucleotide-binding domain-containing protein [Spirosoma sp. HMF3257]|uniref:Crp/Fnr family transcriptional regulator n=2 Tax=Spirosoma telluris TaxID=2183553 RepID=A0A327NWQ7_9BACT|nr:cyclic nucleotide-binding domain-containing protein [Spirosoma telluris]RAI78314.1 Crp/Fnr family transcriptional regulator [Spirosoma telluris]